MEDKLKHIRASTFSTAKYKFYFCFDLALILVCLAVLAAGFLLPNYQKALNIFLIGVSFLGILPVIFSVVKALINRRLTIDLLASIALTFSLLARQWHSAIFIILMLTSARLFARYTVNQADRSLKRLMKLRPTKVRLMTPEGRVIQESIEKIKIGDLIVVTAGERVAVDGVVESGQASVDQSSLTGESAPIIKKAGDEVFSSTLNTSGSLIIKAKKIGRDTTFAKIIELVEKSHSQKSLITSLVDKFSGWYILITLIGAVLIYLFTQNILLSLSILLVTCADDLAVAVPLAFTAGLGVSARRGIIIKGGNFLEVLSKIKTIIFDKTGTITIGRPQIVEVTPFFGHTSSQLLSFLGAVESESDHPAAVAIQKFVEEKKIFCPKITKVHEEPGFGIRGVIDGREILAGKTKYLKDNGIVFSAQELELIEEQKIKQRTIMVLSCDDKAVGFVALFDGIKPTAKEMISHLKEQGVKKIVMLTGDNEKIAQQVAEQVGIKEFAANLLPQDKINYLKKIINSKSKTAMVGDGVNDAAALALADVGIAMGKIGSDAAIDSADIVLMKDNLLAIPEMMVLSKKILAIITQDLWLWGILNASGLILVFAGFLTPTGAAAYNFITDFFPLLNSLRVFSFHRKKREKSIDLRSR